MAGAVNLLAGVKTEPGLSAHDVLAKPLHVQRLEKALDLGPLLNYVQGVLDKHGHG